ncbi:TPA: lactoylglutathione lyase [Pluralibacter gergoviae]|uniref:Lactoylglutathione lyase n=2 Tax=Pluralibacter gergoviae TaxID=61647 RepID=A0A0J5KWS7_PLUGE|nr:lactoylglutathione lyase [Pluralibacter gergoviae]KMK21649.1 lactoylglutathione lyase [Pluralibacter gergoviae]HDS1151135.1 lactoylglutathione lyase [Pluralibacter gergoviae]
MTMRNPDNTSATDGYIFNHTMIRVKSLQASMDFYDHVLGFTPVYRRDFNDDAFTIVYMIANAASDIPQDDALRYQWILSRPGVLELTWNHGTEKQSAFSYHSGNDEPRGFGHLCMVVPDLAAACSRFENMGVSFKKRPSEGRMKEVAFILDPDGYWIEILELPR